MTNISPSSKSANDTVTINVEFVRDAAREAVHRFFRPVTVNFEPRTAVKQAVDKKRRGS